MEEKEMEKMPEIDLSKVKNLEAVEATDSKFANNFKKTVNTSSRKNNKAKYCFTPASTFYLPSKGKFYQDSEDPDLRKGIVKIVPMSIADEEILTNRAYSKNGSTFRVLFDTCMESNYPASRLLSYDGIYLMYALRSITYGSEYEFKIRCGDCGNEFNHTIDIENIDFEDFNEDKDKRDIKLPVSKFTITMHLMRLGDEEKIALLTNQYKDVEAVNGTVISILARTDRILDSEGKELPETEYVDFLTCLPARDRMEIGKSFGNTVSMPKVNVVCNKCGNDIEMEIPWEGGFFLPSE